MSMAMAATLFATNSITTFAEGETSILVPPSDKPAIEIPGGGEENQEPPVEPTDGLPAPVEEEEIDPDNHSIVLGEATLCDGSTLRVVETVETKDEYLSDKGNVDVDGNQLDEYIPVEGATDVEGQTLDYTDVEKIKSVETTVYLEDAKTGEEVTVKNEEGEDVRLELPLDFNWTDFEPVPVVENTDGSLHELDKEEKSEIFYGIFDDDGKFHPTRANAPGSKPYILTEDNEYKLADTVYSTTDKHGRVIFLDEEVYLALKGESTKYTSKKEYEYNDTKYSQEELAKLVDEIKEVHDWDYVTKEQPENIAPEKATLTYSQYNRKTRQYEDVEGPITISYDKVKVTKFDPKQGYLGNYYFNYNNTTYVIERPVYGMGPGAIGKEIDLPKGYFVASVDTTKDKVYPVTPAKEEKKETTVKITVYDENNVAIWSGDKTQYENLRADNVTRVNGKYAVEDSEGERQYIDPGCYEIIRELDNKLTVTNSYYYTVQDKSERDQRTVEFEVDGKAFELKVDFWQNDRIGISEVTTAPSEEEGKIDVVVKFVYSSYEADGRTPTIAESEVTYTVDPSDPEQFNSLGRGTMNIKYTPVYTSQNYSEKPVRPIQPKAVEVVPVSYPERKLFAAVLSTNDLLLADIAAELAEEGIEEEVKWGPVLFEEDDNVHMVSLGEPNVSVAADAEPQPNPNPNPNPTPDTTPGTPTTIDVTPVALAAAPGQVLGAQREETAADGAAVLGASRARGTADETTAPFVRVLVMAAVASAALFLTRKREEEN
jgi:hypothetical protein